MHQRQEKEQPQEQKATTELRQRFFLQQVKTTLRTSEVNGASFC